MAVCPSTCADPTLISNPTTNCVATQRLIIPARIAFFPCTVDLPDPIEGNIKPYFDDGTIVVSSKLRNFTFNDPTFQDLSTNDCSPALSIISGREITFEDTEAITFGVSSPLVLNPYWDYAFWESILANQMMVRAMIIYCDGDVRIPKLNGQYATVSMSGYINYDAAGTPGGGRMEFKRLSMKFNFDPINFSVTPAFNLTTEGINI